MDVVDSVLPPVPLQGAAVFVSHSDDPFFNLALEEYLFAALPREGRLLFLWRNRPSVIIGRFQNPWLECDLHAMRRDGIILARRQSGGGTVYHDRGNAVFTFMSGREQYDQAEHLRIVAGALEKQGITALVNERNDILAGGVKVSGSAFRLKPDRAYHHGTLLVRSDLERLHRYLDAPGSDADSKSVRSVASPVGNLSDFRPGLDIDTVFESLCAAFRESAGSAERHDLHTGICARLAQVPRFADTWDNLKSRVWLFGKTPPFVLRDRFRFSFGGAEMLLQFRRGVLEECRLRPVESMDGIDARSDAGIDSGTVVEIAAGDASADEERCRIITACLTQRLHGCEPDGLTAADISTAAFSSTLRAGEIDKAYPCSAAVIDAELRRALRYLALKVTRQ